MRTKFTNFEIGEYVTGWLMGDQCWHSTEDIKSALLNSLRMLEDGEDGIEASFDNRARIQEEHFIEDRKKKYLTTQ